MRKEISVNLFLRSTFTISIKGRMKRVNNFLFSFFFRETCTSKLKTSDHLSFSKSYNYRGFTRLTFFLLLGSYPLSTLASLVLGSYPLSTLASLVLGSYPLSTLASLVLGSYPLSTLASLVLGSYPLSTLASLVQLQTSLYSGPFGTSSAHRTA